MTTGEGTTQQHRGEGVPGKRTFRLDPALAQRLRLASGLVLMTFVVMHLVNHAAGIFGLALQEQGRVWFLAVWRSLPGTVLLAGAFAVHVGLALLRLWQRRSLRLPPWEWLQILLGLAIPFLLTLHVLGTRVAHSAFGVEDSYFFVQMVLWPEDALRQTALVLLVWAHGCLGVHFWLRLRSWYPRLFPLLLSFAVLLPALALAGFVAGGREVEALAMADPGLLTALAERGALPDQRATKLLYALERYILIGFAGLVGGIGIARLTRTLIDRRRGRVRLDYPGGRRVTVPLGTSVLGASRMHGLPHASVCGGRGRCSTCRVRVGPGAEHLPPPGPEEARVLARLGAPPDVRLACQLRPVRDLAVTPLLPASAGPRDARAQLDPGQGAEREVAVLFADLRGFTRLSEGRLPYDVVFVLNQYFSAMGQAIEEAGGRVDKFVGDGVMALFGIDVAGPEACRRALACARAMALALDALNRDLAGELKEPLRMAIGLHAGQAIVGQIGYRGTASMTAVGDTVNVASRLEALAKERDAELVVAESVVAEAGLVLPRAERLEIELRGRRTSLGVLILDDARTLPPLQPEPIGDNGGWIRPRPGGGAAAPR
jgi:adenylate cyclase